MSCKPLRCGRYGAHVHTRTNLANILHKSQQTCMLHTGSCLQGHPKHVLQAAHMLILTRMLAGKHCKRTSLQAARMLLQAAQMLMLYGTPCMVTPGPEEGYSSL